MRHRLGRTTWIRVHQASYVAAWTMALHSITAGTDTGRSWFAIGGTALIVLTAGLTVLRATRDRLRPGAGAEAGGRRPVPIARPHNSMHNA